MTQEAIQHFLDDLSEELRPWLGDEAETNVAWSTPASQDEALPEDLGWWTGSRAGSPTGVLAAGAFVETWEGLGHGGESENARDAGYSRFALALEKALEKHFGPAELDASSGPAVEPPADWARVTIELRRGEHEYPPMYCCLSPELQRAILARGSAADPIKNSSPVSMEMLMDVEVPVRVSFGRTKIRMKELLGLNTGSLVELDRALGDRVEILVNRRVIARGEVVAVDGNYGVRILELISHGGSASELTK